MAQLYLIKKVVLGRFDYYFAGVDTLGRIIWKGIKMHVNYYGKQTANEILSRLQECYPLDHFEIIKGEKQNDVSE